MKRCPVCKTIYSEYNEFCLNDGEKLRIYEGLTDINDEFPNGSDKVDPKSILKLNRKIKMRILISILSFLTATFFICYTLLSVNSPSNNFENSSNPLIFGDKAFDRYDYRDALDKYNIAREQLLILIDFEDKSPNTDKKLTQHLYNRLRFIDARIELTKICLEARKKKQLKTPKINPD